MSITLETRTQVGARHPASVGREAEKLSPLHSRFQDFDIYSTPSPSLSELLRLYIIYHDMSVLLPTICVPVYLPACVRACLPAGGAYTYVFNETH
jgi:hypothetical protein